MLFHLSDGWRSTYPEAAVGVLAMGDVENPAQHAALDERKMELVADLRSSYSGYDRAAFKALPVLQAYAAYYKRFKKTYHVLLQLESIVLKGRSIPRVAALVEAMFMAELKNLLLTAGHDLDVVQDPVGIDVAGGAESYVRINGQEQVLKTDDMYIGDAEGVLSSILYGPDQRTQVTPETRRVLFTVYAPKGIRRASVQDHLLDIESNVRLVSPEAVVETMEVLVAS
jgi:DNA/RNA-binding domain of Phe-tRNA-synthetase-like protein